MINTNLNFQIEVGKLDPDRYSKALQEYHQILWSKKLPNGEVFKLTKTSQNRLYYESKNLGEFYLSSDRTIPTFTNWKKMNPIISKVPEEEIKNFDNLVETIGAITIWPSNRIELHATINGAKGFNNKICDRLDLTLECIRRFYLNENSPLFETLKRYSNFFKLFIDFKGFIDFFLFQDAVENDYLKVKFSIPFNGFRTSASPSTIEEYMEYMNNTKELINMRNNRIASFSNNL